MAFKDTFKQVTISVIVAAVTPSAIESLQKAIQIGKLSAMKLKERISKK